jgi:hypothetical protein
MHCNLIVQELFAHLPKQRKFSAHEESDFGRLFDVHGNKWLIHQQVLQQTGMDNCMQYLKKCSKGHI